MKETDNMNTLTNIVYILTFSKKSFPSCFGLDMEGDGAFVHLFRENSKL